MIVREFREASVRPRWLAMSLVLPLALVLCAVGVQPRAFSADNAGSTLREANVLAPSTWVPAERCRALAESDVGREVTVTSAELVPQQGGVPEHCLVVGSVTTPGDRRVDSNKVGFHVGLPTEWNGDFHFQGVGGFAGVLGALSSGLSRGYASASTDTGHVGSAASGSPTRDGSWALGNRPAQIDWAYRGTHVATVAAKEVTRAYYRRGPRHSFFVGCSNGGRQGLVEAQRYPTDYDGVVALSPAVSAVDMFLAWMWQVQAQLDGRNAWLSPEDLAVVSRFTLKTAESAGEVIDGLVVNPPSVRIDLAALRRSGELSPAKVRTLSSVYAGWRRGGETAVQGHPIGHEEGWETFLTGSTPPIVGQGGRWTFGTGADASAAFSLTNEFLRYFVLDDPQADVADFSIRPNLARVEAFRAMLDATDPDLSEFADRGGRLLMTHGWADPALNPMTTINYHDEVKSVMGSRAGDMLRLYLVPGMFHCAGGPGLTTFDALTAMERWVRDGVAPGEIAAADAQGRSGPLCPYPSRPRPTSSANVLWRCGS